MPDFEITAPDGRRFIITAPEGASQEDVLRFAQQNTPPAPEQPRERSTLEAVAAVPGQFGAGFNRRLAEVAGAPVDLVGRGLRAVGVPVPEDAFGGSRSIQRGLNAITGEAPAPQNTAERLARGAGSGLVDAASFALPAAGAARLTAPAAGQAPGLANRAATALAAQPGMQAASGMVGGAVGEATDSPLAGAAAAFATPLVAGAAGRVITPIRTPANPQRQALVAAAEREGIPLTAGQATGNRFLQNVESQLEQLPLTGTSQRAIREGQERAFNRASLRYSGTDADNAGPDVLNAARTRIGGVFNDLTARNNLRIDDEALNTLSSVEQNLMANTLPSVREPALNRLRQIMAQVDENGEVSGTFYRQMDSALGRQARGTSDGDLRTALTEVREALREIMNRSISPQDAEAWREARRQYANLMVTARAAGGAGGAAARGNVSPLALKSAVDQSTGRGYAFGQGNQNTLARIGQELLRAPNDSGTAGRTMANNLLTGGIPTAGGIAGTLIGGPVGGLAGAAASLTLPRIIQALMNSDAGQRYLRNQVAQNPQVSAALISALTGQQATAALTRP